MSELIIRRFAGAADTGLIEALTDLLLEAVGDGASIGFMADMTREEARGFWAARAAAAARGECCLLLALAGGQLAGTVSLMSATPPNQPHRADVSKMIVARGQQRRGVGAALMTAVEAEARALGRTTLVLDTISGSSAARLYERAGWQRIGEIAAYAMMPDGTMAPTTIYARYLAN